MSSPLSVNLPQRGGRVIPPSSTLGILGGGQLGRMAAIAARTLGYHVHVLDPDPTCAARGVVDRQVVASFEDPQGAADLAKTSQVVTLEIEKVAPESMAAAATYAPVRPGGAVLAIIQDRAKQKAWLTKHGFPVGPYREATDQTTLAEALSELGPSFVKIRVGGYDGRGQVRAQGPQDAAWAWQELQAPCVVEKALDLDRELSVLVARSPRGEVVVYPPAENHHEQRILNWSVLPGPFPRKAVQQAQEIGREIAAELEVEGLLAVEIFLLHNGTVLVNELSPRPHNTFHATFLSCVTDQFEQLVRAVCNLPLGSVELVRPSAIVNLLGDLWLSSAPPDFESALSLPGVRLYLYGKGPPRSGRKMGHLAALGDTPEEALRRVLLAKELLQPRP